LFFICLFYSTKADNPPKLATSGGGCILTPNPKLARGKKMSIVYLHNGSLDRLSNWSKTIAAATEHEPHLLCQNVADIKKAGLEGRLVAAIDDSNNAYVGSIALWPLDVATNGVQWLELGTIFVTEIYRFHSSRLGVADELHRRIISLANGHNILATTTNDKERKVWSRIGLNTVPFSELPSNVLPVTCVCPQHKTGVANPLTCPYRDQTCTAAIAPETRVRINLV